MSFSKGTFAQRLGVMGDEAEAKFCEVWQSSFERFGWNRPKLRISTWPPMLRHVPDFATSGELIETCGFGRDGIIKMKLSKLDALLSWNALLPVRIFLWDSHTQRWAAAPVGVILEASLRSEIQSFDDGGDYYAISARELDVDWTSV
jgi:hypothetical protein